jgi:hypothetical protein
VVSNVFYDGQLTDAESAAALDFLFDDAHPFPAGKAIIWLDVPHLAWSNGNSTAEGKEQGGYSYRNRAELSVLQHLMRHFAASEPKDRSKPDRLTLAAITPYKLQQREMNQIFRSSQLRPGLR